MRPTPPAIFPIFRSQLQADVLVRLFLGETEESITSLAAAIGADAGNTQREIERLERGAIVTSRRIGKTRLVKANTSAPFYQPLHDLILITMGPAHVLANALANIDGIDSARIYGSWAARMTGEQGPSPNDIDLLVIGTPDRDDLHDHISDAANTLGRHVNPVVVSPEKWQSGSDGFLREIASRPQVAVLPPVEITDAQS